MRIGAVYQEISPGTKDVFITVSGDIPHDHPVTGRYLLAAQLRVAYRRAAHVGKWGLPANGFIDEAGDQGVAVLKFFPFMGVKVQP